MKRIITSLIMVLAHVALSAHEPIIIPTPAKVDYYPGIYAIYPNSSIGTMDDELQPIIDYVCQEIGLSESYNNADINLFIDDSIDSDGYTLSVSVNGITIIGGDYGGVFNGIMTLMQLLPDEVYNGGLRGVANVPFCEISDTPRYKHRGFMLDVCRTWIDKEAVMDFIDLLAYHKINCLRLHLTDDEAWRLEIKSHPVE